MRFSSRFFHWSNVFKQIYLLIRYFFLWIFFRIFIDRFYSSIKHLSIYFNSSLLIDLILLSLSLFVFQKILIDRFYSSIKHLFFSTLTILTTDLCTIAFQLLAYQKEFFAEFSKNLNDTLTLIKNINFRSAIVKLRERQIRVTLNDNDLSASFSANWVIDKIVLRRTIKQFLQDIKEYQQTFQKFEKFEQTFHSQSSTSSFTGNKSLQLSLVFLKHVKNNFSSSNDISFLWSIVFIFQNFTKSTMTEFSSTEHISK